MLRQDFTVLQVQSGRGVRLEIGASLVLFAFVMVHVIGGMVEFLHDTLIFMMIVFSLYLRELARAWAVEAQGLTLYAVKLSGGGGAAEHSRATPYQQEFIAAMGPITSFALWALATLAVHVLPDGQAAVWLTKFAFINLFIGLITALPVQPMDGGKFLYLYLGRTISVAFARRVMGVFGLMLSLIWLPAMLLTFLIFGIVLISLPSISEHWEMIKGAPALEG